MRDWKKFVAAAAVPVYAVTEMSSFEYPDGQIRVVVRGMFCRPCSRDRFVWSNVPIRVAELQICLFLCSCPKFQRQQRLEFTCELQEHLQFI